MRRSTRNYRIKLGIVIAICCTGLFPLLNRFTHHPDETVILLMPPALGSFLWFGWSAVRRIPLRKFVIYLVVLTPVIAVAQAFAAHMAMGKLLWLEVFWAIYFVVAWRAAWAIWKRTIGQLAEPYRRWARLVRNRAGGLMKIANGKERQLARLAMTIKPTRFILVATVFAPLAFGSLIHRFKIGNPTDLDYYGRMPIEEVTFTTDDGLNISGWFLPDKNSDTTIVICHGAGANKHNFISFLTVFYGWGYNSLIFDFRGHGDSDGHTSTFGLFEQADVKAAVDWLKDHRPEYAKHIFGLGSSMGAMALLKTAAADQRIEAVVLDSCYVSAGKFAQHHFGRIPVVGSVLDDLVLASMSLHAGASMWNLDGRDAIAKLHPRPILFIHGQDDFIIPPMNMTILYNLAQNPKDKWLGPGLHSNVLIADFDGYQSRVLEFFGQAR